MKNALFYNKNRKLINHILACISIVAVFTLFILLYDKLIFLFAKGDLKNFRPFFSDEVDYYLEIKSAVYRGLFHSNTGYFGFYSNSQSYTAGTLGYGAHSLFILVPYYLVGLVFGWNVFTPIITNSLFFLLAFFILYFCLSDFKKALLCTILSLSFLPVILYFGTMMSESLMFAVAVILAALYYKYYKNPSRTIEVILIITILIYCLFRITNLVFFIPLIFMKSKGKKKYFFVIYTFVAGVISAICYSINGIFVATYPAWFLYQLSSTIKQTGFASGLSLLLDHTKENLILFFSLTGQPVIFVLFRYMVVFLVLALLLEAFIKFDFRKPRFEKRKEVNGILLSLSLVLIALVGFIILLYDVFSWRDFRIMAPIVLFVCLTAVLHSKRNLLSAVASIMVFAVFITQLGSLKEIMPNHYPTSVKDNAIISLIQYDKNAKDRWDNTVTTTVWNVNLDAGIGMIYLFQGVTQESPVKSKYVLLTSPCDISNYSCIAQDNTYYLYERNE